MCKQKQNLIVKLVIKSFLIDFFFSEIATGTIFCTGTATIGSDFLQICGGCHQLTAWCKFVKKIGTGTKNSIGRYPCIFQLSSHNL